VLDLAKQSTTPLALPETVRVAGIAIPKGNGGELVPPLSKFEHLVFTETHNELLKVMAIGIALNQPVLIEGGSGLGKTTMARYIAALTNFDSYLINCREMPAETIIGKMGAVEGTTSGFGFRDGLLLQAIRNGGIVLLDEYNKLNGDTRSAVQPVIDAIIRGEEYVTIAENHGERVKVQEHFHIIATQNEPNGDHAMREPLDKPDFTRWVFQKFANDLTSKEKLELALSSPTPLQKIPSFKELMERFVEFHDALTELNLGKSQAQPVYYAFVRDLERFKQFIEKFYAGDLNETVGAALNYLYGRQYLLGTDNESVKELADLVRVTEQPVKSSRVSLPNAKASSSSDPIATGTTKELEKYLAIMEKEHRLIGPNEIIKALNVKDLGTIPRIPKELLKALKEESLFTPGKKVYQDHALVLMTKSLDGADNTVMNLKALTHIAELERVKINPESKPVFDKNFDWYFEEDWAKAALTKSYWALIPIFIPKAGSIPEERNTKGKNFNEQSEIIKAHYPEYHRGSAHELITFLSLSELSTGDRHFSDTWGWTETETDTAGASPGQRVVVGYFPAGGFGVAGDRPDFSYASLGAFLRRNF
jgi:energy-coupling factor transporter ATP-binding protein EcfA2